jgi:hypothetical protein
MGPDLVVVPSPGLDDADCLGMRTEPFHVEACVAEFSAKALVDTLLPGLGGCSVRRVDSVPVSHRSTAVATNSGPLSVTCPDSSDHELLENELLAVD